MLVGVQKAAPKEKLNYPYDPNEPIINFCKQINEFLKLAKYVDSIKFTEG